MRIDQPTGQSASLTGSFSGSFSGVGNFEGLTADSVEYVNVSNKPALISGSDGAGGGQIAGIGGGVYDPGAGANVSTLTINGTTYSGILNLRKGATDEYLIYEFGDTVYHQAESGNSLQFIPNGDTAAAVDITTGGSILPATTEAQDLGSSSKRWRDLYLSSGSLLIGPLAKLTATSAGALEIRNSSTSTPLPLVTSKVTLDDGSNSVNLELASDGKLITTDAGGSNTTGEYSGSFSGSFEGDGSGLTGVIENNTSASVIPYWDGNSFEDSHVTHIEATTGDQVVIPEAGSIFDPTGVTSGPYQGTLALTRTDSGGSTILLDHAGSVQVGDIIEVQTGVGPDDNYLAIISDTFSATRFTIGGVGSSSSGRDQNPNAFLTAAGLSSQNDTATVNHYRPTDTGVDSFESVSAYDTSTGTLDITTSTSQDTDDFGTNPFVAVGDLVVFEDTGASTRDASIPAIVTDITFTDNGGTGNVVDMTIKPYNNVDYDQFGYVNSANDDLENLFIIPKANLLTTDEIIQEGKIAVGSNLTITGSLIVSSSKVDFTNTTAISGSTFSGSFAGDGSGLTGVGVEGLTGTDTAISASRHFVPSANNTYDLGSPTLVWRDLYLSSGSLYIDGTQVLSSNSSELRITTDANQSLRIIEEGADTLQLQTENGDLTLTTTGTGNIELDGAIQITAGNNILSSDGNNIEFTNGLTINGDTTVDADLTVTGDLQVTGTTTSVNSTDLEITDKNILIASGALNAAAADQGGITVDGADATLLYISSGDQWQFNKKLDLGSNDFHAQDAEIDSLGIGTAASGTTGEIRATGDITAYYSSDERLKENFAPLTGALDKIKAIGGYEFDWKDGIEDVVSKTGHDIGVKAQELQVQYPDLVHERDNGYLAVDYIKLNAVLIEAVKELAAKVDELSK